jgi:hypothetical protein
LFGEDGDDFEFGDGIAAPSFSDGADFLYGGNGQDTLDGQGQLTGLSDFADGGPQTDTCRNFEAPLVSCP